MNTNLEKQNAIKVYVLTEENKVIIFDIITVTTFTISIVTMTTVTFSTVTSVTISTVTSVTITTVTTVTIITVTRVTFTNAKEKNITQFLIAKKYLIGWFNGEEEFFLENIFFIVY